jgi:DNA-binding protein HU-beta
MNKRELIAAVSQQSRVPQGQVKNVISSTFAVIASQLAAGNKVVIGGFGSFELSATPERRRVDPATGQEKLIPAGKRIRVRATKQLRETVLSK